jgi:iron complex outermembrane recepter protein
MLKNKMRFLLTLVVILLPGIIIAQTTLSGSIKGKGEVLSGASVSASPSGKGTSADNEGKYSLKLPAGNYTITFSFAGFVSQQVNVQLTNGEQKTVDIDMSEDTKGLEDVIVVGARSAPRTSTTTPLPIDVISAADLKSTAQPSFDKQLQYRVPSFNTVNTPVNDATTLLDPYEIRNLGPSRTLILINGKRKNLSSLLYVQFAPGRGETGADLAAIPVDAIKRVEILRDGASAQYGSDAIAGVMNVVLKDRYQFSSLNITGGITGKGDGANYGIAFNSGSNIGSKGYINYTVDFSQQNNAIRSGNIHVPTEIATFGDPSQPNTDPTNKAIIDFLKVYPTGKNNNGTGEISAAKFNVNLGLPVGDAGQFYTNAAIVVKKVFSNANYRTPYWRTDAGLLHRRIPGAPNYTGGTDPLYEGYLGYEPSFEGDLLDYNGTFGFKNVKNGWNHDVSITFGGNQQLYTVENTVNRSLGTASPTSFKPGGFGFSHIVGNYDVSKSIKENFTLAFGTEVRRESYKIVAGDTASYSQQGANSFPGIRAENAGTNSRFNFGAYLDATYDITKDFLINGAIRGEKYSDFGEAFVWKLSSRYKIADNFAVIRASASTGFRAPTLHQIYAQSTQASFAGGTIVLSGLFNNRSKQAFALGIPRLEAEKSTNFTLGLGLNPVKNLSITLDFYGITIKNRVVYSSSITTPDKDLPVPLTELGRILKDNDLESVQFFINGIKTQTQGIDFVASYKNIGLGKGKLAVNVAGNYTTTNKIVGTPNEPPAIKAAGASILNTQVKSLLTEGRPLFKAVIGFDYNIKKFGISLNNTVFGPTKFQDLDNGGSQMNNIKQVFKTAIVTDLNVGYNFTDKISFSVAVNNIFNVLPKWKLELTGNTTDPDYAAAKATLANQADKDLLEGFLSFSGRYRILGYNGSQFSQLGSIFRGSLVFKF